jgi:hypothetical protein
MSIHLVKTDLGVKDGVYRRLRWCYAKGLWCRVVSCLVCSAVLASIIFEGQGWLTPPCGLNLCKTPRTWTIFQARPRGARGSLGDHLGYSRDREGQRARRYVRVTLAETGPSVYLSVSARGDHYPSDASKCSGLLLCVLTKS